MSQNSTTIRPLEEALTALVLVAGLGVGGVFALAKTAGNRFAGSPDQEDEGGSDGDEVDRGSEAPKERNRIGIHRDGTNSLQDDHLRAGKNHIWRLQPKKAEVQWPQLPSTPHDRDRDRDHEEGLAVIRAWEEAAISHTQREKAPTLERLLPAPDQREIRRAQGYEAVLAWEQATMSRFQREKMRRLQRLSSHDQREINRKQGSEAVRAWEQAASRDVERKKGVGAVRAWERAMAHQSGQDNMVGQESLPSVEDDELVVLFSWSSRHSIPWRLSGEW